MKTQQHAGYVILMLAGILLIGSLLALSHSNGWFAVSSQQARQNKTLRALQEAKQALINHAVAEDNTPGTLRCGMRNDLSSATRDDCSNLSDEPRRLDFAGLGLPKPLDQSQECLWYALSPDFRFRVRDNGDRDPNDPESLPINPDNRGSILVRQQPADPGQQVIAVLIAPGDAVNGQARGAEGATGCHAGDLSNYLETWDPNTRSFVVSGVNGGTNDTILTITRDDVFKPLLRRVLSQFMSDPGTSRGLRWYLANSGRNLTSLLNPVGPDSGERPGNRINRDTNVPCLYSSANCFDAQFVPGLVLDAVAVPGGCVGRPAGSVNRFRTPASWLCFNNWYDYIEYNIDGTAATLSLVLNRNQANAYSCQLIIQTQAGLANETLVCQ